MTIEDIIKKTKTKTKDINYWLQTEKEISEWLKSKPNDEDIEKLYTETNYEMIKMICSGYRYEQNNKNS